ncbi:unnamed protein product [Auanema sp. JU1783]|nr:unnamed protein product [Auanema sp. JU1783]
MILMVAMVLTRKTDHNSSGGLIISDPHQCCSGVDRSLLFMAYITKENKLMASLFDLNAFYYSRLVPKVKPDKTIACQNPFLSYIWPSEEENFDLKELVVDGETIYRSMVNMNYSDQLYYPSNYEIPCIYGFSCSKVYNFRVPSIKTQVLRRIGKHLHVCVKSPYRAAECFCALGLNTDYDMDPFDVVFSSLILYGHIDLIIKFIRTLQKEDEMISKIHSCVRDVAESARTKMDSTRPLCSRGQREFDDAMNTFEACINILDHLISVANDIPNDTLVQDLEATRDSSKAYVQYYLCVKSLIHRGMLPLSDKTENIFQKMREETTCRRERGALLNIDKLAAKVSFTKLSENETNQELYPPTIAALIGSLLSLELPIDVKKEWIVYNFIDYYITEGNMNEQNRSKKSIYDYIDGTISSYFEVEPEEIQNIYDAWSEDHSCLAPIMTTTKDLNMSLVSNQSADLLDMTDTFLKELIMSDKPKRKITTEITY